MPEDARRPRRRDAAATRRALLDAAGLLFAKDGYGRTTVRDIADAAGVNVALISRYFDSKEGLFEACLGAAVEDLTRTAGEVTGLAEVPASMARQAGGAPAHTLLILLRSSGDERAERLRLGVLARFGERLGTLAGCGAPPDEALLLRAQLVLATGIGMVVLRASGGIEPLTSATEAELVAPLRDLVTAVLGAPPARTAP